MPKRTNKFQKLVFAAKRHAAHGAVVTESKCLINQRTKKGREVDVVIEGTQADHQFVISIECVDYGRRPTIEWVERMAAKHENLPTDKLILVSNADFARDALEEAEGRGIETVTFRAIEEGEDNARLFGTLDTLMTKNISLSPSKVMIMVPAYAGLPRETVAALPDNTLFSERGEPRESVKDLVMRLLGSEEVRGYITAHGSDEHTRFVLEGNLPRNETGTAALFMQKREPLVMRPAHSIRIEGDCVINASPIAMQRGVLGQLFVAWGEMTTIRGESVLLLATENQGKTNISFMPVPEDKKQLLPKGMARGTVSGKKGRKQRGK